MVGPCWILRPHLSGIVCAERTNPCCSSYQFAALDKSRPEYGGCRSEGLVTFLTYDCFAIVYVDCLQPPPNPTKSQRVDRVTRHPDPRLPLSLVLGDSLQRLPPVFHLT